MEHDEREPEALRKHEVALDGAALPGGADRALGRRLCAVPELVAPARALAL